MPQSNQTEQATPRRREKAREKGQVARSRDLIGAASGMAAIFVLFSLMSNFPLALRGFFRDCLEGAVSGNLRMDALSPFFTHSGLFAATAAALALGWTVALASALAQGGLVFAPASLLPTGSRMSPAAKLGQLFSITALRGLIKSLLPAAAVTYIAVGCLRRDWLLLMALPARSCRGMLGFASGRLFEVAWKSALVLLVWSVLDYLFERQHLSSELKMSRQELKDEYKETEGNPIIKGRIRRLQRQVRRRRMLEDTKRAAVVITNPTELRHRARVPPRYARARRRRQGTQPVRRPDQGNRALGEHSHGRKSAARPRPLSHGRGWTKRSAQISTSSLPKSWPPFTAPNRALAAAANAAAAAAKGGRR